MAEEFLNINPPDGFPDKPVRMIDDAMPEGNEGGGGFRSIFVFFILVLIVAASFFVSFQLGSRILSPVKKSPEQKIKVAIPEPPASIATLQKLQAIMSRETVKAAAKPVAAKMPPRPASTPRTVRQTSPDRVVTPKRLTGKHYYKVQAGYFTDKAAADELGAEVRASGFDLYVKKVGSGWRVQVGAYRTKDLAEELRGKLAASGFSSKIIYE